MAPAGAMALSDKLAQETGRVLSRKRGASGTALRYFFRPGSVTS
jgi:hypothetical protein